MGARRSQEEPGEARRNQKEPKGARRSREQPGGARSSQGFLVSFGVSRSLGRSWECKEV